jgi:ABC-type Na+ transport system ATPase subunit NatA
MVGSLAPTSGSGFVGGVGIGSASASTSTSGGATESSPIGICPQSDPIYDNLSPLEHIVFFLGLVGAGGSTGEAQRCLDAVGMEPAEMTKRSKNLSGGNKRKLTLAIALTCLARAAADGEGGMPPVVVLDEVWWFFFGGGLFVCLFFKTKTNVCFLIVHFFKLILPSCSQPPSRAGLPTANGRS